MLRSDETRISSHLRHVWSSARRGMGSMGGYGAKEKADGGAGLGFDVVALLQALPDPERIPERKAAVDVGRRHAQLRRDVGHRGLGEAHSTEQRLGRRHDALAGIVGLGPGLGAHGRVTWLRVADYFSGV